MMVSLCGPNTGTTCLLISKTRLDMFRMQRPSLTKISRSRLLSLLCSLDYDTQVTVFTGGCSSLQCVGGNDDSPDAACDVASEYVWPTVLFEKYNIVVSFCFVHRV